MTAPVRRKVAALDHWHQATAVRQEWLEVGLSTEPSDRPAAEAVVSHLYARHGRPRPQFLWADSPKQAFAHVTGVPGHHDLRRWLQPKEPPGRPPIAVDIATGWSAMMAALDDAADHPDLDAPRRSKPATADKVPKTGRDWPDLPPEQALQAGVPLRVVLRRGVRESLWQALIAEIAVPVRAALGRPDHVPVCWYGQQDASWLAYYDTLRRLGLAAYPPRAATRLDEWATLARSTGWWWPGEEICVLTERPAGHSPTVTYRDGWSPR
ncbi:hypothetical protein GCM10010435_76130 [Winogradskya consettensis]|uniref:DUF6745 domain-containing protein n=1 Tax=Winogradskya consettensis TaxID=113560 RepID=A0A919T269_9ACTN|nr:hypothetical protein [Actinoplanes consettensis]GIM84971.1 hypothetical protein Aco04nite_94010 [Actinoplanes consettensis]